MAKADRWLSSLVKLLNFEYQSRRFAAGLNPIFKYQRFQCKWGKRGEGEPRGTKWVAARVSKGQRAVEKWKLKAYLSENIWIKFWTRQRKSPMLLKSINQSINHLILVERVWFNERGLTMNPLHRSVQFEKRRRPKNIPDLEQRDKRDGPHINNKYPGGTTMRPHKA